MTGIIRYAYSKGIKVIPMFDIPGHMNAVIAAMKELDISVSVYSQVGTNYPGNIGQSFDPTNTKANEFAKGLLINYIKFFGNIDGVEYFNIAGDECGFAKMDADTYTAYAKLMNALNAEVKAAGMTTLMFNDGVNYKNKTLNDNVLKLNPASATATAKAAANASNAVQVEAIGEVGESAVETDRRSAWRNGVRDRCIRYYCKDRKCRRFPYVFADRCDSQQILNYLNPTCIRADRRCSME